MEDFTDTKLNMNMLDLERIIDDKGSESYTKETWINLQPVVNSCHGNVALILF